MGPTPGFVAAIVIVNNRIEQRCRALGYAGPIEIAAHAGHDALLQAIHTHWHPFNRVRETANGIDNE